jgi:tRNA A-37 threonylcarbamoyl transferase component Bud32/DNA-directed RNA polymerase specialized sigma24 family protein
MGNDKSEDLLRMYRDGSSAAATELFDRYVQRLISLTRGRIAPQLRRRIDPEDVVQSAYRSFFLHAANGQYRLDNAGDLWRLLAAITLHKLHGQVEKHTAQRRDYNREQLAVFPLGQVGREPTPAEVITAIEQMSLICDQLTDEEGRVLNAFLQGHANDQIAKILQRSPRTVRRVLNQVWCRFENELPGDARKARPRTASGVNLPQGFSPLAWENYTLEKLIGCGGMGKVYRTTVKSSGKVVALKTLHKARLADQRAIEQFLQEAQLLAGLHHQNIVGIEGIGRFPGGGFFLVMDFLAGGDLQSRLDNVGVLTVSQAAECVKWVAQAVELAHAKGIVHCDLKPANILLSKTGAPVVSDFGFAQLIASGDPSPQGHVGGTRGYLAPEVRRGLRPSVAADIYALGALLWALMTGLPPANETDSVSEKLLNSPIVDICRKCLAADPAKRYQTAGELATVLEASLVSSHVR